MPESKGRDHKATAYTPPRTSKAAEPNPTWWAPVFITLLVLGLLWIVVYYVTGQNATVPLLTDLAQYNLVVGIGFMAVGFVYATHWE